MFIQNFTEHVKAGYAILNINTTEETRAVDEIRRSGWLLANKKTVDLTPANIDISEFKASLVSLDESAEEMFSGSVLTVDAPLMIKILDRAASIDQPKYRDLVSSIENLLSAFGYSVVTYDVVSGFAGLEKGACVGDPYEALLSTIDTDPSRFPKRCIFVFHDIHRYVADVDPRCQRVIRYLFENNLLVSSSFKRPIVLMQPEWSIPGDIKHCCASLEFENPSEAQLRKELEEVLTSNGFVGNIEPPDEATKYEIVRALRGLTSTEANNALYLCGVRHRGFPPEAVTTINRQKAATFKNDDVLEYIDAESIASMQDIGGYRNYLNFVEECKVCYSEEAAKVGLRKPKGVLLLGIAGTGKSTVAMATAKAMRIPLIKYDFSSVFAGIVGESETRQRLALKRIKSQGPCVVLIDEADKAFGGIDEGSGDSGVSLRVFGRLLSWMANENSDAFVIMTMNKLADPVTGKMVVPVESIRTGRLDATFYTDFPSAQEREEILTIHMKKNGASFSTFKAADKKVIVDSTNQFTGAELEQICIMSVRRAFVQRRELQPTLDDVLQAHKTISPVYKLAAKSVQAIMDFCQNNATPVSLAKPQFTSQRQGRQAHINPGDN
jgi:ATP-dependent 26S proteasome regulatory subunit